MKCWSEKGNWDWSWETKISLVILLTVCQMTLIMFKFGEFGIRSVSNPIIDIFLNSHHLSA